MISKLKNGRNNYYRYKWVMCSRTKGFNCSEYKDVSDYSNN